MINDREDEQIDGVADFYKTWPAADVVGWPGPKVAELSLEVEKGGSWTGGEFSPHQLILENQKKRKGITMRERRRE